MPFSNTTGAATNSLIESNAVTITTIDPDNTVTAVVDGEGSPELEVNESGTWSRAEGVRDGDTVKIRLTSSPDPDTARTATLYAAGASAPWTVTTAP